MTLMSGNQTPRQPRWNAVKKKKKKQEKKMKAKQVQRANRVCVFHQHICPTMKQLGLHRFFNGLRQRCKVPQKPNHKSNFFFERKIFTTNLSFSVCECVCVCLNLVTFFLWKLQKKRRQVSMGGNVTTSTLRLTPTWREHDAVVICNAVNPSLANASASVEVRKKLVVHCESFLLLLLLLFLFSLALSIFFLEKNH